MVGVERSGTSWLAGVLRSTPGTGYVGEPDHPLTNPFAGARGLGDSAAIRWSRATSRARTRTGGCGRPPSVTRRSTSAGSIGCRERIFRTTNRDERLAAATHPEHPRVTARAAGGERVGGTEARTARTPDQRRQDCARPLRPRLARARIGIPPSSCAAGIRSTSSRARSALNIPPELHWLAPAARAQATVRYGVAEPSATDPGHVHGVAYRAADVVPR